MSSQGGPFGDSNIENELPSVRGSRQARTPTAVMLEKVNLGVESLRLPSASHEVEVAMTRLALRHLYDAVSKDAGETIAAMKLLRRSQHENRMLRERVALLETENRTKDLDLERYKADLDKLRRELKLCASAKLSEERARAKVDDCMLKINELKGQVRRQVQGLDDEITRAAKEKGQLRTTISTLMVHMSEVQAVVDDREAVRKSLEMGKGRLRGGQEVFIYSVKVKTGDRKGAGTDAGVYVKLKGTRGKSERLPLQNDYRNFSRDREDTFKVWLLDDLGDIRSVVLGHDGSGDAPTWYVESVGVINEAEAREYEFPCERWFGAGVDDSQIERELKSGAGAGVSDKAYYEVSVCTSDLRGAATDANVTMTLAGSAGDSGTQKLEFGDDFERGATDVFKFECTDVGRLDKVTVGHDASSDKPTWHLSHLTVRKLAPDEGEPVLFPCGQWFDADRGDGMLQRTLAPGKLAEDKNTVYRVEVTTGNQKGSGTDANVTLVISGANGSSGEQKLEGGVDDFEKGQTDTFKLKMPHLGEIRHAKLISDGSGTSDADARWYVERVEITDEGTPGAESVVFEAHRWLGNKDGDELFVTLMPGGEKPPAPMSYQVKVFTGDVRGAGTDANVTIEMHGTSAHSPSSRLKLESGGDDFERGKCDVFSVKCLDVGDINRVRIGHDNSSMGPAWFLDKVEVYRCDDAAKPLLASRKKFECGRWLALKEDDGAIERDLLLDGVNPRDLLVPYEVRVKTGDVRGAGTDAGVYIIVKGAAGDTGRRLLESGKDDFEREHEDVFNFQSVDVGEIQRITIGHDNKGLGAAWFCDSVVVTNGKTRAGCSFPLQQWFDKSHGDGKIERDVEAGAVVVQPTKYRVRVTTGNKRGAGTDANVTINLFGEAGTSGEKLLESGKDDFEKGITDEFMLDIPELGDLNKIRIEHDNSSRAPAWFVDTVVVENTSVMPAKQWIFQAYRWLSKDEGDGQTFVEISSTPMLGADGKPKRFFVNWTVRVRTGDIRGAGTDANVCITLLGSSGASKKLPLESGKDDFERGQLNTFSVQTSDIGTLTKVRIGHDGEGSGSGWHLDDVEVEDDGLPGSNKMFVCRRWLDMKEDDGKIVRDLLPSDPTAEDGGSGTVMIGGRAMCNYQVTVVTGSMRGAGTDANVFIELVGDKEITGKKLLESSSKNFDKGVTDTFELMCDDIGELQKIRLGHDNAGFSAGWFCESVTVQNVLKRGSEPWFISCNRWFATDEEDNLIERELVPGAEGGGIMTYTVLVVTGSQKGAGTDADVTVTLYGSGGNSGERKLETRGDNFERSSRDTFKVSCVDLGQLERVRIGHNNEGFLGDPGWFLDRVEVWVEPPEGEEAAVAPEAKSVFGCNMWLDKNQGDGQIVRVLSLGDDGHVPHYTSYEITVYTGQMRGAGTDANVSINLFGSNGMESGQRKLEGAKDCFERAKTDTFRILLPSLQDIQKIRIEHDGKGIGSGWYVEKVVVQDDKSLQHWVFPLYRWLDDGEGDGQRAVLVHSSTEEEMAAAGKPNSYTITAITGDRRGAGTDANVFIELIGDGEESSRQVLEGGRGSFDRGSTDEFRVSTATNLGVIRKIRIGHDDNGWKASWFLKEVLVVDDESKSSVLFPCNKWFDSSVHDQNPDGVLVRELTPASGDTSTSVSDSFKIEVVTGDRRGAGTDAKVFVELVGSDASSGTKPLDAARTNFERGTTDVFRLECAAALGALKKLRIGHDNGGWSAGWFLESVIVTNERTGDKYSFGCNRWLDKKEDDGQIIRELLAGSDESVQLVRYKIIVKTADRRSAGTSARVFVNLVGELGQSGDRPLESARSNFSRAAEDVFELEAVQLGKLLKVRVGHDNKGLTPAWFLQHMTVVDPSTLQPGGDEPVQLHFPCGRWLARNEDDHQIVRELLPVDPAALAAEPEAGQSPRHVGVTYRVSVHTGDVRGAGTDANVTCSIFGSLGDTGSRQLNNKWRNCFERQQVDHFEIEAADLGELQRLRIAQDGKGLGAGWFLDKVVVTKVQKGSDTAAGEEAEADIVTFTCGRWLDSKEDDGLTERELFPDGSGKEATAVASGQVGMDTYQVSIHTGDVYGAGTDANISIELTGELRSTGLRQLRNGRKKFERNCWDTETLSSEALGALTKVRIGHDSKGFMAGWYLERLTVMHVESKQSWEFACGRWFDRDEDDGMTERELLAVDGLAPGEHIAAGVLMYRITTVTSSAKGAGTDANVSIVIIGDKGTSGARRLVKPGLFSNAFKQGASDDFELELHDVGEVRKIIVSHDGAGLGAGWCLSRVIVTTMEPDGSGAERAKVEFTNDENEGWLDKKMGDGALERRLVAEGYQSTGSLKVHRDTTYVVSVSTGRVRNAGTSASVFVTFFGASGESSGERRLPAAKRELSRANCAVFRVAALELGDLSKIRVRQDNSGSDPGWFLEKIDVTSELTGAGWSFPCNRWLDRMQDDGLVCRDIVAEMMAD